MKLHQYLESLFHYRILSNDEIPTYMKKLSQAGKVDLPKELAILTELLVRVAALEDKLEELRSARVNAKEPTQPEGIETMIHFIEAHERETWKELRAKAVKLGVFKPGLNRQQLETAIASKL